MSGTNRLILSENEKNKESQDELAKDLLNANSEGAKDQAGEYEKESE